MKISKEVERDEESCECEEIVEREETRGTTAPITENRRCKRESITDRREETIKPR